MPWDSDIHAWGLVYNGEHALQRGFAKKPCGGTNASFGGSVQRLPGQVVFEAEALHWLVSASRPCGLDLGIFTGGKLGARGLWQSANPLVTRFRSNSNRNCAGFFN